MTAIKVCGLTRPGDAELAAELGADLIGLNFWPGSPRCVDSRAAREVVAAVAGRSRLAGVFVNKPPAEIEALAGELGLDLVQLHGDESRDEVTRFGARAIKVFRLARRPRPAELEEYPEAWGFLFDRLDPRRYGGTGEPWRYDLMTGLPTAKPVLLAGGIGPDNVAGVLAAARPWGIDVCSGVESAPGIKDPGRLRRLFEEVRRHGETTTPA